VSFDETMIAWADRLDPAGLDANLTWFSGGVMREITKPRWVLVTHMFNHQTHHRGQVHWHADAGRRQAAYDGPAGDAGVTR